MGRMPVRYADMGKTEDTVQSVEEDREVEWTE